VIKVVDGGADFPALTVDAIDGMIFAGQGRRVRGCIDAPEGTRVQAHFRTEDQADPPWQRFAEDVEIVDGRFELCFLSPDPALSGVIRVRVEATAPDGTRAFAHTPDTLVLVATPARCTAGESVCCPEPEPAQDAGAPEPPNQMETDAQSPDVPTPDASPAAGNPDTDAVTADEEASAPSTPAKSTDAASSGGCSAASTARTSEALWSWFSGATTMLLLVFRRLRRGRSDPGSR
jgi:hypothetical protein